MIFLAQFPLIVPRLRADLPISRPDRSPHWVQVSKGAWIPVSMLDDSRYKIDAITRARGYLLTHPQAIASHFAALALHRVRYWVSDQPSHFYDYRTIAPHQTPDDWLVVKRKRPERRELPTCNPDPQFPNALALRPNVALAGCLSLLERNVMELNLDQWWVPKIPGISATRIRQIQLADATRTAVAHAPYPTTGVVKGHCDSTLYREVIEQSTRGCQSPQESLLRLMVQNSVDPKRWVYVTQVEVHAMFELITTLDGLLVPRDLVNLLKAHESNYGAEYVIQFHSEAWERLRDHVIAFQYDGSHHFRDSQRRKDINISGILAEYKLTEIRVVADWLRSFAELRTRLAHRLPESFVP